MNTLSLQKYIHQWTQMKNLVDFVLQDDNNAIKEIEGISGSVTAFFAKEFNKSCVFIVPSEKDCSELILDLTTVFTDQNGILQAEIYTLPWWGFVPYRSCAKGAVVFGQRASFLAKLASFESEIPNSKKNSKPKFYIISQRALMTPVPPADYVKSLVFSIKKGQSFDPVNVAEKLSELGYLRVPRVTVRGEFTLRGEVLDIFMPGEEFAHRIVFDFDEVEQIKTFNPETQSSLENLDSLLIYPMKEVIWNEELVSKLEDKIKTRQDLSEYDFSSYLTELMVQKESEGEELLYPLLWQEENQNTYKNSVLSYLRDDISVFYCDYDRQKNAQESFDREYLGLYRKAKNLIETENARPVPPLSTAFVACATPNTFG